MILLRCFGLVLFPWFLKIDSLFYFIIAHLWGICKGMVVKKPLRYRGLWYQSGLILLVVCLGLPDLLVCFHKMGANLPSGRGIAKLWYSAVHRGWDFCRYCMCGRTWVIPAGAAGSGDMGIRGFCCPGIRVVCVRMKWLSASLQPRILLRKRWRRWRLRWRRRRFSGPRS